MPNPYLIIGLMVAWAASLAGAFHFGTSHEQGQEAKRAIIIKDAVAEVKQANQEFADNIGLKVATSIGKIRITNTTNQTDIHHEREIQTKLLDNPDCTVPASVIRLLNNARGYGPDGSGTGATPGRVPADGKAGRPAP